MKTASKIIGALFGWAVISTIVYFIIYGFNHPPTWQYFLHLPVMPGHMVLLFSFCMAFTWVEILKIGSVKPFNCLKCMCGWIALIMAAVNHTPYWYMYVFVGIFAGALFDAFKMRWL